jgi:tetratricopeptide (TPR) repeat protein
MRYCVAITGCSGIRYGIRLLEELEGEKELVVSEMGRTLADLGHVANALGRLSEAERYFRQALAADPSFAPAWFHLGMLYTAQGLEPKGRACLEKGLKLEPYDPMGCLQAGLLYMKEGRPEKAGALFKRALSRPLDNTELKNRLIVALGMCTSALGQP